MSATGNWQPPILPPANQKLGLIRFSVKNVWPLAILILFALGLLIRLLPAWADHPAPAGVDPAAWHRSKVAEEEFYKREAERQRDFQRRIEAIQEETRKLPFCGGNWANNNNYIRCTNNIPIPGGYTTWQDYDKAEAAEKRRLAEEAAERARRAQEARAEQQRREQEAHLEQLRREGEIEAEKRRIENERRLVEQDRINAQKRQLQQQQEAQYRQVQQYQQQYQQQSSGIGFFGWLMIILLAIGGFFAFRRLYEWEKQREAATLVNHRKKVIEDWGSLNAFRETLDNLDEQLEMIRFHKWSIEKWEDWITQDVVENWDEYRKKRNDLFRQYKRYEERGWEPEVAVAEADFNRPRSRANELMEFFKRQCEVRWKILTMEVKPHVPRPKPLSAPYRTH